MEVDDQISILAVDDLKENLLALEAIFEGSGLRLVMAQSGQEALKHLLDEEFAVILMDSHMPDMDGLETAAAIRAREKTRYTPIIFVTATQKDFLQTAAGYEMGAADYIFKPLIPSILKAKVSVFVDLYKKNKESRRHADEVAAFKIELEKSLDRLQVLNAELQELSKEAAKARDSAVEASRFKSEFLANMSHEIRTPMNGILGMIEILLKSGLNEKQREYANTVREAGRSLLAVINDILDFSKIEVGKLALESLEFELVPLVESIADLLLPQARLQGDSLLTFIDPKIARFVQGDPSRIRQILTNLAGNAIKFSERGEIVIRSIVESETDQSITVKFSVSDRGIGLTDEEIGQLFQPFVQADLASMRKHGGTGLGLSISKRLVELMGGQIGVESVKGHGSTFWFSVPFTKVPTEFVQADSIAGLAGIRVMVVDDEPGARQILHDYLTAWGMRDGSAGSVEEAMTVLKQAAKTDPYRVVLIDLVMPGSDGLQLGKAIRENQSLKNTTLILVTGFDKPGTGEEAILLGFDAYLTKPVKQSQLLNVIATLILATPTKTVRRKEAGDEAKDRHRRRRRELILIAEDHPVNQQVAILMLKQIGFEAHVAENGRKAIELLQRVPYSLIFMDCQMPEMDGFETTRTIRKQETLTGKRIPIVAMTAHAIEGNRDECLAAGMDDYISKPIDPGQLESLLVKWLPDSDSAETEQSSLIAQLYKGEGVEPVDLKILEKKFNEHAGQFLSLFLDEATPRIDEIKKAVGARDAAQLLRQAHALKGASATIQADPIYRLCRLMEAALRDADWQSILTLSDQLDSEFRRLEKFVKKIVADTGSGPPNV